MKRDIEVWEGNMIEYVSEPLRRALRDYAYELNATSDIADVIYSLHDTLPEKDVISALIAGIKYLDKEKIYQAVITKNKKAPLVDQLRLVLFIYFMLLGAIKWALHSIQNWRKGISDEELTESLIKEQGLWSKRKHIR